MSDAANPISIREATPGDVSAVLDLIAPYVAQKYLLPRSREEVEKLIPHGFIAEAAGEVIGFSAVEIYSRKLAELQCLAVAPDFQGRGIAKRLIELCVQRAKENDVYELLAITASEKPFRDCGFDYSLPNQKRALFIHPTELE